MTYPISDLDYAFPPISSYVQPLSVVEKDLSVQHEFYLQDSNLVHCAYRVGYNGLTGKTITPTISVHVGKVPAS